MDQKVSRTELPRNDLSSHGLPARSGKEKSGALKGSISQVSTDDGSGSSRFGIAGARIQKKEQRRKDFA